MTGAHNVDVNGISFAEVVLGEVVTVLHVSSTVRATSFGCLYPLHIGGWTLRHCDCSNCRRRRGSDGDYSCASTLFQRAWGLGLPVSDQPADGKLFPPNQAPCVATHHLHTTPGDIDPTLPKRRSCDTRYWLEHQSQ